MPQTVHIIGKLPHQRFQEEFTDGDTPEQILETLQTVKRKYGFVGFKTGPSVVKDTKGITHTTGQVAVSYADPSTGFLLDHPETIVAIGTIDTTTWEFIETKRIKGPPKTATAPTGK